MTILEALHARALLAITTFVVVFSRPPSGEDDVPGEIASPSCSPTVRELHSSRS